MISVKGLFRNGVARPAQPIAGHDGQPVIITFLEEAEEVSNKRDNSAKIDKITGKILPIDVPQSGGEITISGSEEIPRKEDNSGWETLLHLIKECAVETNLTDLAQQHDYYLYNKPKRE